MFFFGPEDIYTVRRRRLSSEQMLEPEERRLAFLARDVVNPSAMADAIAELSNLIEPFG